VPSWAVRHSNPLAIFVGVAPALTVAKCRVGFLCVVSVWVPAVLLQFDAVERPRVIVKVSKLEQNADLAFSSRLPQIIYPAYFSHWVFVELHRNTQRSEIEREV
jgi:hypothetical protein